MPKKVYDIKPPKLARKTESNIKEFLKDGKQRSSGRAEKKRQTRAKEERFFPWRKVAAGAGVVVVLTAIYLFFKLPRANIEIWPKIEKLLKKATYQLSTEMFGIAQPSYPLR